MLKHVSTAVAYRQYLVKYSISVIRILLLISYVSKCDGFNWGKQTLRNTKIRSPTCPRHSRKKTHFIRNSRVVDEDVQPAILFDQEVLQCPDAVCIIDVELVIARLKALTLEVLHSLLTLSNIPRGQKHIALRPLFTQGTNDGKANTLVGSRDLKYTWAHMWDYQEDSAAF